MKAKNQLKISNGFVIILMTINIIFANNKYFVALIASQQEADGVKRFSSCGDDIFFCSDTMRWTAFTNEMYGSLKKFFCPSFKLTSFRKFTNFNFNCLK